VRKGLAMADYNASLDVELQQQLLIRIGRGDTAAFSEPKEQVLQMALYEGLTHEEIADRQQLPLGTVKTWIRRGISKIKNELEAKT